MSKIKIKQGEKKLEHAEMLTHINGKTQETGINRRSTEAWVMKVTRVCERVNAGWEKLCANRNVNVYEGDTDSIFKDI